ncbi:MAG: hypothetical protein KA791_06370 [Flavobacteriales bacterium]|nr:hypothetical protein [Flavobacteriales bacterium]
MGIIAFLRAFAVCTVVVLLVACSEDDDGQVTPQIQDEGSDPTAYAPLTTGSYWIYQRTEIDTSGNETPLGITDSCYVAGDTVIGANTYAVYVRPYAPGWQPLRQYLRDSTGYLVDQNGRICFAENDFGIVFNSFVDTVGSDTMTYWRYWMVDDGLSVTVPAWTFSTKTYHYEWTSGRVGSPQPDRSV